MTHEFQVSYCFSPFTRNYIFSCLLRCSSTLSVIQPTAATFVFVAIYLSDVAYISYLTGESSWNSCPNKLCTSLCFCPLPLVNRVWVIWDHPVLCSWLSLQWDPALLCSPRSVAVNCPYSIHIIVLYQPHALGTFFSVVWRIWYIWGFGIFFDLISSNFMPLECPITCQFHFIERSEISQMPNELRGLQKIILFRC